MKGKQHIAPGKPQQTHWHMPVILLLLAAIPRIVHLGKWSLWEDEVLTVLDARAFPDVLRINPLPYLVTKASLSVCGNNAWGARLGFALVGCLSVLTIYYFGRLIYHADAAFWAALLTAIHPWHIFWSQNARSYALTFLFGAVAAFSFYLGMEQDRWRWFGLSLTALLCLVASHLLSGILLFALAGYSIALKVLPSPLPQGWRWRYLLLVFGPFMAVGLVCLHPSVFSQLVSGWGHNTWARSPFYVLATFVYGLSIPIAVMSLPACVDLLRNWRRDHLFLVCLGGIPLLVLLVVSLFLNVAGYYLFFCIPAYLMLAGWALARLLRWDARLTWPVVAVVLGVLLAQILSYHTVEHGGRSRWGEAFADLGKRAAASDTIVVPIPRMLDYYLPDHTGDVVKPKQVIADPSGVLVDWASHHQPVWFVLDDPTLLAIDPTHTFRDWLYQHTHLVRRFPTHSRSMDRSVILYRLSQ